MDNGTLREIARFTTLTRKVIGRVDPIRLSSDVEYAKEIFAQVQAEGDEEVIMLSIKLSEKLMPITNPTVQPSENNQPALTDKYKFGARS